MIRLDLVKQGAVLGVEFLDQCILVFRELQVYLLVFNQLEQSWVVSLAAYLGRLITSRFALLRLFRIVLYQLFDFPFELFDSALFLCRLQPELGLFCLQFLLQSHYSLFKSLSLLEMGLVDCEHFVFQTHYFCFQIEDFRLLIAHSSLERLV